MKKLIPNFPGLRTWSLAALGVICLIFAGEAKAIELFRAVPLPDDGLGSTTKGLTKVGAGTLAVVGSKINLNGMSVPMVWDVNLMSNTAIGTELPLPMGVEGEAVGSATFPNGDRVVVGNVSSGGATWGVVWRRWFMGVWGMPQLLCSDATESYASRTDYSGESGALLEVVGSDLEGGRWLPVFHHVSMDSVVTVDLPLPQGWNGAALDVDVADEPGEQTTAVGWVEGPNGRMRPAAWINTGQQWMPSPISMPNSASGLAHAVIINDAGTRVVGEMTRSGRTLGFYTNNPGGGLLGLRPLDGYANSTATHLTDGLGNTSGDFIFGTSSNPGGNPVATGWLPLGLTDFGPVFAQQLLLNPGAVAEVRGFKPADLDASTVGEIVATPGGQPQACLFIRTDTNVPDSVDVLVGQAIGEGASDLVALWHKDDDSDLIIRARQMGGMRTAVADLTFTPFGSETPTSGSYTVVARAQSNQPSASGTLNVYAFNWNNQQWQLLNSFLCPNTDQEMSAALPDGFSDTLINPETGAIRLRLEFIGNGNGPIALVARMARIIVNGN